MTAATRSRDPEATRNAILDAAEELFVADGFGNVSMSQIAGKAEVSKSLIHHHFGSKEELWKETKERAASVYIDQQIDMLRNTEPDLDLLRNSMIGYFQFLKHNPQVVRLMCWMNLEYDSESPFDDKGLLDLGTARIKEGQKFGEIRSDLDPRLILISVLNMVIHWFKARDMWDSHYGEFPDDPEVDERYLETMLKIFFEGILPRE